MSKRIRHAPGGDAARASGAQRSDGRDEGRPRAPRDGERGTAPRREDSRDRPRPQGRGSEGLTSYRIEVGHQHGATPREIVGAIANESGLEGRYIGRIDIRDDHSLVDLPEGMPREIFNHLKRVYVRGQALRISLADGSAGGTRRERGRKPRRRASRSTDVRAQASGGRIPSGTAAQADGSRLNRVRGLGSMA
jgi:ATP-dependent RNA helicase DeaD